MTLRKPFAYLCIAMLPIALNGCGGTVVQTGQAKVGNASPLLINTATVAPAVADSPYSATINVAGGTPGYTFAIASGALPSGLTLASKTGTISGQPTSAGSSNVTVLVHDDSDPTQTQSASLTLKVMPKLTVSSITAPTGTAGTAYSLQPTITGGIAPYSVTLQSGSWPQGLTLNASNGLIAGTPTAAGLYTVTLNIADSGTPEQSQAVTLAIDISQPSAILTLQLPNTTTTIAGDAAHFALSATGGTPSYTYSVASGQLPAGLALDSSTGFISGTAHNSGTSTFSVSVSDQSTPVQTASAQMLLTVVPQLTLPLPASESAQVGSPYSLSLLATGGVPSYSYSLSSGTLPPGLSFDATGTLSGTPTTAGTYTFGITANDHETPEQTASAQLSISIAAPSAGTTWYVRADGGTRYSPNNLQGQCDGKADAAYPGSGVDQHCAFGDYRFLYDDQHTYPAPSASTWAIVGGDTVIIDNTKQWRVGHDQGASSNDPWCAGTGASICYNPPVPSGTFYQHTRILGRNFEHCSTAQGRADHSQMTQLFGGYGVGETLNLSGTQYVDVECIEVSSYTNCVVHGSPNPIPCNTNFPLSDFAQDGVDINSSTSNLLLQDMYIHSVAAYGIHGNIANPITLSRVDVAYTGSAGINLDDGTEADSPNGNLTFNYGSIAFAGCAPEYPAVHAIPVTYCFDQNSGGYGDGFATANVSGLDLHFDHDIFAYNTEDCIDPGHVSAGSHTLTLTNNLAYGCEGASFKWGGNFLSATVENNIAITNCARMAAPIPGAPATYNQYLSLFCRAGDAISFNFLNGGTAVLANNTFVGTSSILFDIYCGDTTCANSSFVFRNNIVRAYADTTSQGQYNGGKGPAGLTYTGPSIGKISEDHDMFFGPMRNQDCSLPTVPCEDPQFINEPSAFVDETTLDNYSAGLSPQSPAIGAGIGILGLLTDYTGAIFSDPPSLGAMEKGSTLLSN